MSQEQFAEFAAAVRHNLTDDFLWVRSVSGETEVFASGARGGGAVDLTVSRHAALQPDVSWAFYDPETQSAELASSYRALVQWLGDTPALSVETATPRRYLVVKVDRESLWFLRFPLSAFCQLGEGFLGRYVSVEFVVTAKSFQTHCLEREKLRRDLADVAKFLSGTCVVLNTYREFEHFAGCAEGTNAMLDLFGLLRSVQLNGAGQHSLRWYLNPSLSQARELLANTENRYLFANFEAASGVWETGEGRSLSWLQPTPTVATRESLELDADISLSHLDLMRVFHCFGAFDPYTPSVEPAAHESIVAKLLSAGAARVEGGMTKETYLDFLHSLAMVFVSSAGLGFILRYKALEAGRSWDAIQERLLDPLGRPPRSELA